MSTLITYLMCCIFLGVTLYYNLLQSLQFENDEELKQLFNNKLIRFTSISVISLLWIIIIPCICYFNIKEES